ncbi:hypothetical protein ACWC2H_32645 [Streptomyces sp. 900105755]
MIREPFELVIGDHGQVELPLGILAEAGLPPGAHVLVYSAGDGRIVLRRAEDALQDLVEGGTL